jgi:hypothetical protein
MNTQVQEKAKRKWSFALHSTAEATAVSRKTAICAHNHRQDVFAHSVVMRTAS